MADTDSKSTGRNRATEAVAAFRAAADILCCPVCRKRLRVRNSGRMTCLKEHSYDIAKNGYVNFAASGAVAGYDSTLFRARRHVFEAGLYDDLAQAVADVAAKRMDTAERVVVVDAGCGEGFYTARLMAGGQFPDAVFVGADLSRDAVKYAADTPGACWCVADLARLPVSSGAADMVLNILSPANYGEFMRVLGRKSGLLVKVVPGPDYLKEIREAVGGAESRHDNTEVVALFERHMTQIDRTQYRRTFPVTPALSADLLAMTPMTAHAETAGIVLQKVTVDLLVLCGVFR